MSEQEQNHSSFHLKNGTDKSGRLPISEQYLQEKELPDQTEDINTKGMTETAILRLKSTQEPSTNKTNSIAGSSYSITASYQDMIKDQQASLSRQRKTTHTFKVMKITIIVVLILTAVFGRIYFVMTHLPEKRDERTVEEKLCDSLWAVEDQGNFTFSEDMTVTEKGQTTRTGTYEINDQNVLIMTFKDETISYLIEYDSDGNMRWVHSYNGFEDVIYPTSIPKAK